MRSIALPRPLRGLPRRFAWALALLSMLAGCALFSMMADEERAAERKQQQALEEQAALQRKQAEQAARQRELFERLTRLRAELQADREVAANALLFAKAVVDWQAQANPAAPQEAAALAEESVNYLLRAMTLTLTIDQHVALAALPRSVAVDHAIVTTCGRFRPLIRGARLEPFMDTCIERAGNDVSKLAWPGFAQDQVSYRNAKARRLAEEERARVAEEERARVAEERRLRSVAEAASRGTRNGTCYSDSECGGGACRNNQCTTAGGTCYSDSECPGGSCRNNRCTTAGGTCYSDSECGGGACRNNRCTTAGGTCYSDSECPGGTCRNNRCS